MANSVVTREEIILWDDETIVTIKSLNIASLRTFFNIFEEISSAQTEQQATAILTQAAGFCLANFHPEAWEDKDKKIVNIAYVESQLSMDHIKRIFKVCAGIDFDDQNLLAQAAAAAITTEE